MNPIAEEIESYLGSASITDEEYLAHYGMPRRSGRYPWGSGEDPYQSSRDFLGRVEQMRKSGFTYTDENGKKWTGDNAIAKSLGYNSTDFRTVYAIAKDERRSDMVATAKRLRDKEGMNNSEIGRKMGINESSVRSLLDPNSESRMKQARDTAKNNLLKQVEYLTNMVYSQLGITQSVLDGTADEKTMLNYTNRTVEPIISAIVDELKRKFLTKTARSQLQSIVYFRDPFRLVPVNDIAEIADKFTRNEIMTSNEIRQIVGMQPSKDPKADELVNSNISQAKQDIPQTSNATEVNEEGGDSQNG